jgi:hypothetical protein
MYESGHSEERAELRSALLRLDAAVARHEALLAQEDTGAPAPSLQVLRNSIAMMRQEADRLRLVLADG